MANIKGTAVIDLVRLFRKNKEKLYPLLGPEDRAFVEQRIVISNWYDTQRFVSLMRTLDKTFGAGDLSFAAQVAAIQAEQVIEGVYKDFKSEGADARRWWKFSQFAWRMYHDTGQVKVVSDAPTEKRFRIEGLDEPDRVHCITLMAWTERSTKLVTQENWDVKEVACRATGAPYCEFVMTRRDGRPPQRRME